VLKSTYAVAREMRISDESVRIIENMVLDPLRHCLDLEANGEPITPMRLAKALKQPVASEICSGQHPLVTAPASIASAVADAPRSVSPRD